MNKAKLLVDFVAACGRQVVERVDKGARMLAMASTERRSCEHWALYIAMMYEEADDTWVQSLISRAYQVARGARTPHHVLMELSQRICTVGFKPPFGTPEEMIPG